MAIVRWADNQEAVGRDGGKAREFKHPFVQACAMFFGEFLCLVTFKVIYFALRRRRVSLYFNLVSLFDQNVFDSNHVSTKGFV